MDIYQTWIHKSRYARYLPEKNRREHWEETVDRYLGFMFHYVEENKKVKLTNELKDSIRNAIINLDVMPSMRAMMSAGKALERDNTAGFNCSYVPIDDPKSFDEAMHILMCLAPETLIKTKSGNKKICELTTEDEILSLNEELKQYEYIKPEKIFENPTNNKEKIELTFEDGSIAICTSDHKFLTKNRGWVEAKDLTEQDDIQNFHEIS